MEKLNLNNERIEITVLRNFIFNEAFTRKALPFCKEDYFTNRNERLLFREIDIFVNKYKNIPTKEALVIELGQRKDINEDEAFIFDVCTLKKLYYAILKIFYFTDTV